ncbi:processed acidic surface protein [Bacillus sp. OV322]|uniref:processed acidic surface protein n=1 Tax=Bacillus sp. OV322 TaxID=1882764 RepID=UPI0008EFAB19|nr:processed acidic surface protein [Bacillus sp. OV322]SFC53047.1 processed acidic surface protein [Bacillus sp. OV322]
MKKISLLLLAFLIALSFSPNLSFAAQDQNFESDLNAYLKELSAVRGFDVTKEDIEMSLSQYDEELADFKNIAELKDYQGEAIAADYSNLDGLLSDYDLTMDELKSLLKDNGESLDDYVFVSDLDDAVSFYGDSEDGPVMDEAFFKEILSSMKDEIGLTDGELQNISEHFAALDEKLSTPEATAKFEELGTRMEEFDQFETLDQLSPQQVKEFLSIYDEMFSMLELKADFHLVKGGKETPLTLWDLLNMDELTNANLKVSIYDLSGKLLADLVITGDMVDSTTVKDIGKDVSTAAVKVKEAVKAEPKKAESMKTASKKAKKLKSAVMHTEKGGKLPKTAGNYVSNVILGLAMILSGFMLYRTYRRSA